MKIIKWKYAVKEVPLSEFSIEKLKDFLLISGAKGWELVTINRLIKASQSYFIIMKKPCGYLEDEVL